MAFYGYAFNSKRCILHLKHKFLRVQIEPLAGQPSVFCVLDRALLGHLEVCVGRGAQELAVSGHTWLRLLFLIRQ